MPYHLVLHYFARHLCVCINNCDNRRGKNVFAGNYGSKSSIRRNKKEKQEFHIYSGWKQETYNGCKHNRSRIPLDRLRIAVGLNTEEDSMAIHSNLE